LTKAAWKWANRGGAIVLALLASPLLAPQLLAFPYVKKIGGHKVYSEAPIEPGLDAIVTSADLKVARSPISPAFGV